MKIFSCLLSCLLCFSHEPCLTDRVEALKQEAAFFVQKGEFIEPGSEELVLKEIFKRLDDPALWIDPEQYRTDWTEKRGLTREFRIPEDTARFFFDTYVFVSLHCP